MGSIPVGAVRHLPVDQAGAFLLSCQQGWFNFGAEGEAGADWGSYPELRQQAEMWDGESDVDPVGWMLQQQALENERMAAEKEMEAEEYLKAQLAEATGEFSFSLTPEMQSIKATDGEVPVRGTIKGEVFDAFVAVLERQNITVW